MPGKNKPANQEPVGPKLDYENAKVIEENDSFVAYEVLSIPDGILYLYKLYNHKGKNSPQYRFLKTKIQEEKEALSKLFGVEVYIPELGEKNQIGILMPRYYKDPFSVNGEEYWVTTYPEGEGNYGRVFKLEPLNPEKEPLAMKVYFAHESIEGSLGHANFVQARETEVKSLAEYFDTQLSSFQNRTVLLMPFLPDSKLPKLPLALKLILAALVVQKALIEAQPRAYRKDLHIHGDLKRANMRVEVVQGEDKSTYIRIELIDPLGRYGYTPVILAPEAFKWTWLGDGPYLNKGKWSIKAEMYAASAILATLLTASEDDPRHVFSKKLRAKKTSDIVKKPFCFDLMEQTLREAVEDEIQKFKETQKNAKPQDSVLPKEESEDDDEIQLEELKDVALQRAIEEVIENVKAMGSQDPDKRPDPFLVLRALIDAANLCLELEQAREEMGAQKVNEDKGKEELQAMLIEPGVLKQENEAKEEKKAPRKAVIPSRHHLLSQKSEKKEQSEMSEETIDKIADNRVKIREKTDILFAYHQQTIQKSAKSISDKFKEVLNRLKKVNSQTSKNIINLINSIKPSYTLEKVLGVIGTIEKIANRGIVRATERKKDWLGFFYTDNSGVYQEIVDEDIKSLKVTIEAITNNEEYKNMKVLEGEIKELKAANQQLLKGEAIPLALAPH